MDSKRKVAQCTTADCHEVEPASFRQSIRISCVIPCLNEHDNLTVLLPQLRASIERLCDSWEIIVADDGSVDATATLMKQMTQTAGFRYLQLSRNFGKEAALSAGLEASSGDVVICLDADLQHPLDLIEQMMARWYTGAEMVYAVRESRQDESLVKRMGAHCFYRLMNVTQKYQIPLHAGDFRLMDRCVVNALNVLPERTRFMKALFAWVGFTSQPVVYTPDERRHGKSRFSSWQLMKLAVNALTSFTTWPLHLVSMIGFLFALLSFLYGSYLTVSYFVSGNEVSGWTTIVTALCFLSGVNLISVGVVGQYVAHIFNEVKSRPLFIVKQQFGCVAQAEERPPHDQ